MKTLLSVLKQIEYDVFKYLNFEYYYKYIFKNIFRVNLPQKINYHKTHHSLTCSVALVIYNKEFGEGLLAIAVYSKNEIFIASGSVFLYPCQTRCYGLYLCAEYINLTGC